MEFIETPVFRKIIDRLLTDEEHRFLQLSLAVEPRQGQVIPQSGGIRKMRFATQGSGKRGGVRVLYYLDLPDTVYMLYAYSKAQQEDLNSEQKKALRELITKIKHPN